MEINERAEKSKKFIQNFGWGTAKKTGVDIVRGMVNEITVYCTNVKETWLHRNGNWENNDAV